MSALGSLELQCDTAHTHTHTYTTQDRPRVGVSLLLSVMEAGVATDISTQPFTHFCQVLPP